MLAAPLDVQGHQIQTELLTGLWSVTCDMQALDDGTCR